jgi:hypothetical protein
MAGTTETARRHALRNMPSRSTRRLLAGKRVREGGCQASHSDCTAFANRGQRPASFEAGLRSACLVDFVYSCRSPESLRVLNCCQQGKRLIEMRMQRCNREWLRFILIRMDSPATTRASIAGLLCAVLLCLAVHSPHCNRCDGPSFFGSPSPQTLVHQQLPDGPDGCNGACWCCVSHAVSNTAPVIDLVNQVFSRVWPAQLSEVEAPR